MKKELKFFTITNMSGDAVHYFEKRANRDAFFDNLEKTWQLRFQKSEKSIYIEDVL